MIRPRFRKGTADVIWEGVLTDWEFSCPVVEAPNGIVEAVRPYITVSTNRSAIGCTETHLSTIPHRRVRMPSSRSDGAEHRTERSELRMS